MATEPTTGLDVTRANEISAELVSYRNSIAAMGQALELDAKSRFFNASVQDLQIIRDRANAALRFMARQGYGE